MSIKDELNARAKFKAFEIVEWRGGLYKVWNRFWRRSEDAFYYDLLDAVKTGTYKPIQKKVPEHELEPTLPQ